MEAPDISKIFLSTPSARRATAERPWVTPEELISIHALREEGDDLTILQRSTKKISIHALREEGDSAIASARMNGANFYPRPPRGGRPPEPKDRLTEMQISIHALREEGDSSAPCCCPHRSGYFYPRPPRGGRRAQVANGWRASKFLSTPSARRATGGIRPQCR